MSLVIVYARMERITDLMDKIKHILHEMFKDFLYLGFIVYFDGGGSRYFLNYNNACRYFDSLECSRELRGYHIRQGSLVIHSVFHVTANVEMDTMLDNSNEMVRYYAEGRR